MAAFRFSPLFLPEVLMRKLAFIAAMLLLTISLWLSLNSNSPRAADAQPKTRKLEYLRKFWHDLDATQDGQIKGLNELGSNGREMSGIVPSVDPQDPLVVFKRPQE
jgi:hypothetical protein